MSPDDLRALLERLDPGRQPGRIMLVARLGHGHVAERLPRLMEAARDSGHEVLWLCDPLHGNNRTANGTKLRLLPEVIAETRAFVRAAQALGIHPGGLHLEVTPRAVHECADRLAQARSDRPFESLCDPRLNPEQAARIVAAFTWAVGRGR